ncbi:MAG: NAD-dependent epimerase/dehydratase family protein [Actinomycetota bacterium]
MRVVVTGGAGFIGSHVCERLITEGHEVLALDNLSSGEGRVRVVEAAGVDLEKLDVREPAAAAAISRFKPGLICHLAAQIDVRKSVEDPVFDADVNIGGTLKVAEAARQTGARMISTSSGGTIYGEVDEARLPVDEGAGGRPTSPYGISKKVTEDYLEFFASTHGLAYVNLALANVFGPRQDPHGEAGVVAIFALLLLDKSPCAIYGDGEQTRDYVYVDDVADAFLAAAERGTRQTFNIGTGRETSVNELYRQMAEILGTATQPEYREARAGELQRSALDASKAKKLLGWTPKTDLTQGLKATIDSLRPA